MVTSCPLLALNGHSKMHAACPLSGANPTSGWIYSHTPKPQAVEAKNRGPARSSRYPAPRSTPPATRLIAPAPYCQNHSRTASALNNHAPAARNGLTILYPSRSHANADNAKASVVTPVTTSSHVTFEAERSGVRLSIAAEYPLTPAIKHHRRDRLRFS